MTSLDLVVISAIALSALLAYVRGVVREIVAIASWIVGFVAAMRYADAVAASLAWLDVAPAARHIIAFVLILLVVLFAGALVAWLARSAVRGIGLGFVDRFLGAVFGVLRGALLALIFALIAGLTALPRQDWWQNSMVGPALAESALAMRPYLPADWATRLDFSAKGRPRAAGATSASRSREREEESCAES